MTSFLFRDVLRTVDILKIKEAATHDESCLKFRRVCVEISLVKV